MIKGKKMLIEIKNLKKIYSLGDIEVPALNGVDLAIEKNDIYNDFLTQRIHEKVDYETVVKQLDEIVND
jgi:flagellar biosynthesis/type III secretory pathway ATPase